MREILAELKLQLSNREVSNSADGSAVFSRIWEQYRSVYSLYKNNKVEKQLLEEKKNDSSEPLSNLKKKIKWEIQNYNMAPQIQWAC